MKKSLIALAVLAASGASFAQSSVTIYGLIDAYVGSNKTATSVPGQTVSNTVLNSGGVDSSRWGIKGSEDLGGGLKANFVLEQGFSIDDGSAGKTNNYFTPATAATTASFSRYAYVGFSGGFGEIKLGKTGTAYDDVENSANAVFNSNLSAQTNTFRSSNDYTWNPSNSILYATPVFGGFSGEVSYALGENKSVTTGESAGNVTAFNVKYAEGPVLVTLGYQTQKVTGNADAEKFTQLNGAYDFGVAKLQLAYGHVSQNGTPDTNEYSIGVTAPLSTALSVSANVAQSKDDAIGTTAEVKRTGYGLGLSYTLSKRTYVYGGYRAETSKQNGIADTDTSLFAVGVHHVF
jgi:predicted porin